VLAANGVEYRVDYEPGESSTGLFGGNSNWRGPIWFPTNYLLIESLQKFHHYLGDDFQVECPTGSGRMMNLWEVAAELSRRRQESSCAARMERGRCTEQILCSATIPTGANSCCSMNTFTGTPAREWAPVIRPAGPA